MMEPDRNRLVLLVVSALLLASAALNVVTMTENSKANSRHTSDVQQIGRLVKENRALRDEHDALPARINNALSNLGNQLRYQTARAQNAEVRVDKLRGQCISKGILVP